MAKQAHPHIAADLAAIKAATEFTAYLRLSPSAKIVERFDTLAEAAKAARKIAAAHPTRKPLIYAITGNKETPVPAEIVAEALGEASQPGKGMSPATAGRLAVAAEDHARPAKAAKSPKAAKGPAKSPGAARISAARREALEKAQAGKLPAPPNFEAETHRRFRPKLAELVALAKAGDAKGLRDYPIKPISTSPKALDRYRNLCVIALKAKAAKR